MFRRLDEKFTEFSLDVEQKISQRSLLNVPEKWWRFFKIATYMHAFFSIFLFVFGSVCFCLGVQYSQYYSRVNCGDGSGIWPPIVNMVTAVAGQYALRVLHMYWPAFIHFVMIIVAIPLVLLVLIDSAVAVPWWKNQPIITYPPTEITTPNYEKDIPFIIIPPITQNDEDGIVQWKYTFEEMDLSLCLMSAVNVVLLVILLGFYIKWWIPLNRRQ